MRWTDEGRPDDPRFLYVLERRNEDKRDINLVTPVFVVCFLIGAFGIAAKIWSFL